MHKIFIGWDAAETLAYRVAERSCVRLSSQPVDINPLRAEDLYRWRLLWRPVETDAAGQAFDHLSGAPQSTGFASSRFLVPKLAKGWALFIDCDMVFMGDVSELFALADPRYAVMVVKHDHAGSEGEKMCGKRQTQYSRKNWSSVMLFNCDHPANQRLSLEMINAWPGVLLHRFAWLRDEEIGELPMEWNWLVGVQPKPQAPKLAHFTLGGPWFQDWEAAEHDEIFHEAAEWV